MSCFYCSIAERLGDLSRRIRIKHESPPRPEAELTIVNITAIRITDTSTLITWNMIQQDYKVCSNIYQKGIKKLKVYTWYLQILEWKDWKAIYYHADYTEIKTKAYYYSNEGVYNTTLNKIQCTNQSYLLINLSPSSYYKFQMMVDRRRKDKENSDDDNTVYNPAKTIAKAGSRIYYFGKQSEFLILTIFAMNMLLTLCLTQVCPRLHILHHT